MGGGPSQWGAEEINRNGGKVYASPAAARTFNDDLEKVAADGVILISEDEGSRLPADVIRVDMRDFDFDTIQSAFDLFGVNLTDLDAIAVAVFDHGAAPVDVSDRKFRFDYLDERIRQENRLNAFAYLANNIPQSMTRLQSVADSAKGVKVPLIVMDTAPAAVVGALYDPQVSRLDRKIIANVGNFHTLAFRLGPGGIEGCFEHHTGLIDRAKLDTYLRQLADGSMTNLEIFEDHGHGALIYSTEKFVIPDNSFGVVVTGPRRSMMLDSSLHPYFPAPFGDMMLTGCFGLLSAVGDIFPAWKDEIEDSLNDRKTISIAPWDVW
jgi:uncharacterized protein (DUF1786 family)